MSSSPTPCSTLIDGTLTTVWGSDSSSVPRRRCSSTARWASGWPRPCCLHHRGLCCDACDFCGATPARQEAGVPRRRGKSSESSLGNGSRQLIAQTTPHPAWRKSIWHDLFWHAKINWGSYFKSSIVYVKFYKPGGRCWIYVLHIWWSAQWFLFSVIQEEKKKERKENQCKCF